VLAVAGVSVGVSRPGGWAPLLSDVSFDVERGEVVAVVGVRRTGKTTLLKVAAGIETPDKGSVRLGGLELKGLSDRRRTRLRGHKVVWVCRAGPAQGLEVRQVVGWPLAVRRGRRETERRAVEMLERVGALEYAREQWRDLAPCEQVLVGLAQGFAGSPSVVVIDDLMDALGPERTEKAFDLLRDLMAESESPCGVLMSASDLDSAIFADRIWSLRDAKLTPTLGHGERGEVIPFPSRAETGGA
jgi:predicted ABC-type transport system involved in lysophospholipase L1 biosynthesis ATPase subunit